MGPAQSGLLLITQQQRYQQRGLQLRPDETPGSRHLNSPLMWWFNWRFLPHMKDEALSPMGFKMEHLPVARLKASARDTAAKHAATLVKMTSEQQACTVEVTDWLNHSFGIEKAKGALANVTSLDADELVSAVASGLPKKRKLTAAEIAELKREQAATIEPARQARSEILSLERKLSDLVNTAYGLTPEEIELMWRTAPPRMPLSASAEAMASSEDETTDTDDEG